MSIKISYGLHEKNTLSASRPRQYYPVVGRRGKNDHSRIHRGREISLPFPFINDPKHWRQRAKEALAVADHMDDLQAKAVMIRISYDYERLAKRAEERELRHVISN
jgi:hypothetical protein